MLSDPVPESRARAAHAVHTYTYISLYFLLLALNRCSLNFSCRCLSERFSALQLIGKVTEFADFPHSFEFSSM